MDTTKNPLTGSEDCGFLLETRRAAASDFGHLSQRLFDGLPRAHADAMPIGLIPGGTERIVIAEDDPCIRKATQLILEDLGYQVDAYASGVEALRAIARDDRPIALLLTDYDMPGLTGYELAQCVRTERPGVRIIIASGWSEESISEGKDLQNWPPFLPKPYTMRTLARKLREVLDDTTLGTDAKPAG